MVRLPHFLISFENGNAVVAAIYNYENHTTEFQMILDKDQRERAKGSKYMQSKPGAFSGKPIAG